MDGETELVVHGPEFQHLEGEMLAICEECSKKYNIDPSKMKGERARFSCQECGHIIVVVKQGSRPSSPDAASEPTGFDNDSL